MPKKSALLSSLQLRSRKVVLARARVAVSATVFLVGGGGMTTPNSRTKGDRKTREKCSNALNKYIRKYLNVVFAQINIEVT